MQQITNKFNIRLIFIPLGIITLLSILSGIIIHYEFAFSLEKESEDKLVSIARIYEQVVINIDFKTGKEELNAIANAIASSSRTRITIIDLYGKVLIDSSLTETEIHNIGNHGSRPEVVEARGKGIGISKRYSDTLNSELIYAAILFRGKHNSGFIRVSKFVSDLNRHIVAQRFLMIIIYTIIFLIMLIVSILSVINISRKIGREQALLEDRVEERTSQISMLFQLGTMLTACQTKEEALEIVGKVGSRLLPQFFGALSLYRASRNLLEVRTTWNGEWQGDKFFQPEQCWSLRTGKNHLSSEGIIACSHSGGSDKQSMLCLPMIAQGETIGVMHIIADNEDVFTVENQNLASAIVEHTSLALANIQLQDSLKHQATRDTLTGLYNRRFLMDYFDNELNRSIRNNKELGILMIDIDHFKNLNDSYGHDAGDLVLTELAGLLQRTLRLEDIVCRYGGEEFIILLPETGLNDLLLVAEKLHKRLDLHEMNYGSVNLGQITISIGAACFPDHGSTQDALIKAADEALYKAKQNGRNRTEIAQTPKEKNA